MQYLQLSIQEVGIPKLNGNRKLRVRSIEGMMQIRPTARTKGKLPIDEFLVDLEDGGDNTLKGVILPLFSSLVNHGSYMLEKDKYGWYNLVECPDGDINIYFETIGE